MITKINSLGVNRVDALMKEMCELNVLQDTGNGSYRFARYSFYQMMGTLSEIEDEIAETEKELAGMLDMLTEQMQEVRTQCQEAKADMLKGNPYQEEIERLMDQLAKIDKELAETKEDAG